MILIGNEERGSFMERRILTAKELGALVRETRKSQDFTQYDLAGITGVGRRFISDLENGKETAQLGKVLHIVSSLGIVMTASHKWK